MKQTCSQNKYKYFKPNKVLCKLKIASYNLKLQLIFYIFSLIDIPCNIFHYKMLSWISLKNVILLNTQIHIQLGKLHG